MKIIFKVDCAKSSYNDADEKSQVLLIYTKSVFVYTQKKIDRKC